MFADLPVLMPHLDSGKLIALALGSNQRAPARPDLPTTVELGLPTVLADNWYGLFAPAATPPDIITKLTTVATAALREPELQALYLKLGSHAEGLSGPAFAAFVRAETAKWGTLAKAVGARLD